MTYKCNSYHGEWHGVGESWRRGLRIDKVDLSFGGRCRRRDDKGLGEDGLRRLHGDWHKQHIQGLLDQVIVGNLLLMLRWITFKFCQAFREIMFSIAQNIHTCFNIFGLLTKVAKGHKKLP